MCTLIYSLISREFTNLRPRYRNSLLYSLISFGTNSSTFTHFAEAIANAYNLAFLFHQVPITAHRQYYLGVGCWGSGIHGEGVIPPPPPLPMNPTPPISNTQIILPVSLLGGQRVHSMRGLPDTSTHGRQHDSENGSGTGGQTHQSKWPTKRTQDC